MSLSGTATDRDVSSVPQSLTLEELERFALANNPTIPAADALVQQAQGLWRQAGLYPNPTVGYLRSDPSRADQSRTQGVFVSQDFVTAGKLRLAQAEDLQEIELRQWQLYAQQERVLNDVRIRFYEVLGAQQAVQSATELEELAVEGVRVTEELLKAEQGSRPDLLQAEIQLHAVRASLQQATFRHQSAWRQLANVVGCGDLQPVPVVGDLESDIPVLDWDDSLQKLLAASPLLRAQAAQIRAAGYDVTLSQALAIPNVNVQVVAEHDAVQKFNNVSTLISVPVPIFNHNQGNIQHACGNLLQQQKEYERVQLALRDQLAATFEQYVTARDQVERYRNEILPRTKENLDLTTQGYKLRQFDFVRVLTARQAYFEARTAHIDALTALRKLALEISGLQLTGGLNPTEVGTALQSAPGGGAVGARNILLQQLQQQGVGAKGVLPGAVQGGQ